MKRYRVSDQRGWSKVVQWRIRASVTDETTGESLEFSSRSMAEDAADLLDRATHGERPTKPPGATPFAAYNVSHGADGWTYIWHGDGALNQKAVARTRSDDLARRTADLLSRASARPPRKWRGVFKSYF